MTNLQKQEEINSIIKNKLTEYSKNLATNIEAMEKYITVMQEHMSGSGSADSDTIDPMTVDPSKIDDDLLMDCCTSIQQYIDGTIM